MWSYCLYITTLCICVFLCCILCLHLSVLMYIINYFPLFLLCRVVSKIQLRADFFFPPNELRFFFSLLYLWVKINADKQNVWQLSELQRGKSTALNVSILIVPIWETGLEGEHLWKVVIFLQPSWGEKSPACGPGGTLQCAGLRSHIWHHCLQKCWGGTVPYCCQASQPRSGNDFIFSVFAPGLFTSFTQRRLVSVELGDSIAASDTKRTPVRVYIFSFLVYFSAFHSRSNFYFTHLIFFIIIHVWTNLSSNHLTFLALCGCCS